MNWLKTKFTLIFCVFIFAVVFTIPSFKNSVWPYKKINLGLDLQGGMHLLLNVKTPKAVSNVLHRLSQEMRYMFRKERIRIYHITTNAKSIVININSENFDALKKFMAKEYTDLEISSSVVKNGEQEVVFVLKSDEELRIKKMAVEQALETIRNRIDAFGVSEPDIRIQGKDNILIQLPGVTDTENAKKLIGKTALLEFKLVDESYDVSDLNNSNVPVGMELLEQMDSGKEPLLVEKKTLLTGDSLQDARVQIDQRYNKPYVSLKFDKKGARAFARITGENTKRRLAVVLDNKVYTAPVIQDKITGGLAMITGGFSMEEAHILAIALRAGALPAPVQIIEERTVGPTLGHDSIKKGLMAMTLGGLLVVLFMLVYFKVAGAIADLALVLNIFLITAGLASLGATLTLPGIAGMILTIGMAVDANVLIFERIKEEQRKGFTIISSITSGFQKASLTILDANVTTLIAAVILFQFGTGPVKGFAVTLSLGVLASLFTALVVSRFIFDYLIINKKMKKLWI